MTPRSVVGIFTGIGVLFIPIGIAIINASGGVVEVEVAGNDYSGACCASNCGALQSYSQVDKNPCNVSIVIPRDMQPPIYAYYRLGNFYQNHRRYVSSRSARQLKGNDVSQKDLLSSCNEADTPHHVFHDGVRDDPAYHINPCGLIAWSLFNDTFALRTPSGDHVALDEESIAWASDIEGKYANNANGSTGQNFPPFAYERTRTCAELPTAALTAKCVAADVPHAGWCFPGSGYCAEDQHFMVWMRCAGLPNFRKLYAVIRTPLPAGTYTVTVSNGVAGAGGQTNPHTGLPQQFLYPVSNFGAQKSFVLSTSSWVGGRNLFLGYAYVIAGVVFVCLALCFFVKYRAAPREPGTAPYVTWCAEKTTK